MTISVISKIFLEIILFRHLLPFSGVKELFIDTYKQLGTAKEFLKLNVALGPLI